jgi:hypothetical protein
MTALSGITGQVRHDLTETWIDSDFERRYLHTMFIIGIADLTQNRKNFENKFVSHLRSMDYEGVTSHSLVPHLDAIADREALVQALQDRKVEGAITVRLVSLDDRSEAEWAAAWKTWVESRPRIRGLIEETLPISEKKVKHYGIEVALWESTNWDLIWAARSDTYKRKELKDAAGNFVQRTMGELWDAGLVK